MRSIFIVVILLVTIINVYPQKALSLEESIKIALQKNTSLQKSEYAIPGYEANLKNAYGNLLPSLDADGSWRWQYKPELQGRLTNVGGVLVQEAPIKESRNYSAGAGASWLLFNGLSNYAAISQSKNNLEAAKANLRRLKESIVFETISRYYSVLNAKQILDVREENLAYNRKNLEIITEKNKLGAVTLADVYNQQVQVGNAELSLIQAQNELETLRSDLLNFLGLNVLEELVLTDTSVARSDIDTKDLADDIDDLTQIVETALNNREDYRGAKYTLESSYNGITSARGSYFPRLSNSAGISMSGDKLDFNNLWDSRTYSVGLTLSIPIFSGWSTESSVQQAKVRARTNEVVLVELEREIKINIKKNYLDLQASKKRVEVSESNVAAAEQNRRIEQEKYNLGSGTLVNLLLASSQYTAAQSDNINARFDYLILKSQLEFYIGEIDYKKFE